MKALIQEYVPLAPCTTLSVGGPARYFIHADSENTVVEAVRFSQDKQLPILVLGGGSNLLVADTGFPGVVLHIGIEGVEWSAAGNRVALTAGAGEVWDNVVAQCVARDLAGVECLSGIPGSVGGTPVQNVGAYGQEVSEVLESLHAYDRHADKFVDLDRAACVFGYRSSVFNSTERNRYIVLRVRFELEKHGAPFVQYADVQREFEKVEPSLAAVRDAVRRIRARKAMLLQPGDPDCRSAGSFFKNPILTPQAFADLVVEGNDRPPRYPASDGNIKTAAAWLIEHSGFQKGYTSGSVGISSRHTLAIINKGGATAADVVALAREIQQRVEGRFGVRLSPEPVFVGFDDHVI